MLNFIYYEISYGKNIMEFEGGCKAVIDYDPEIEMYRVEFIVINGGVDFYAPDPEPHQAVSVTAASKGFNLNGWITDTVREAVRHALIRRKVKSFYFGLDNISKYFLDTRSSVIYLIRILSKYRFKMN